MSKQEMKGLVPALRFPEFEKDEEWQRIVIGKHLTESRVKGSKGDIAKKITVKLWGNGVFEKQEALKGSSNTQYYRRKSGQFIYSKLDFLNQAFGIIPKDLDGHESTVDLPCFDTDDDLDVRFLLEYVQRKEFYKRYGEIADGGRKAKRIQVETFLNFPIYLPRLKEQQKIADCLASIDELVTFQAQKLDRLKAHKKGLMQQLFPAEGETLLKLRFPEFRDKGEWKVMKIEKACERPFSGGTPTTTNIKYYGGKIPFIRSAEIDKSRTELFLTKEGLMNSSAKLVKKGDVLVALYGANSGDVALGKIDGAINQAILCLRSKSSNAFLYQYLSYKKQEIIRKYLQGGQGNLSGDIIKSIELLFPEGGEQQRIADCLASIDEMITAQTQKIEALKAHKKGLIQQLFPAID